MTSYAPGCSPCSAAPHGIEVIGEARNGEEAVALAAALSPDVVLMDLRLGSGIDGVEATRRIARTDAPGSPGSSY